MAVGKTKDCRRRKQNTVFSVVIGLKKKKNGARSRVKKSQQKMCIFLRLGWEVWEKPRLGKTVSNGTRANDKGREKGNRGVKIQERRRG